MPRNNEWDLLIKPRRKWLDLNLKELIKYKDLLLLFVRKDIVTIYKQTILGPIWFIVQPLLSTLVFMFVFGNVAKLSPAGLPQDLFYLSGVVCWGLFSTSFTQNATTFITNMSIFGKVYFPRIIIPLSKVTASFVNFGIQFLLFLLFLSYHLLTGTIVEVNQTGFLLPIYMLILSGFGLGLGLIFSSLTTKYRDFKFTIEYGTQLLMYLTPVILPLTKVPAKMQLIFKANPVTHVIEAFRYSFIGEKAGGFSLYGLGYAAGMTIVILFIGFILFNKTEQNFIDTV